MGTSTTLGAVRGTAEQDAGSPGSWSTAVSSCCKGQGANEERSSAGPRAQQQAGGLWNVEGIVGNMKGIVEDVKGIVGNVDSTLWWLHHERVEFRTPGAGGRVKGKVTALPYHW